MNRHKDLAGMTFGKLTVLILNHKKNTKNSRRTYWLCKCECGNQKVIRSDSLTTGHSQSCGCSVEDKKGIKPSNYSHGDSKTRLYRIWNHVKNRCNDPKNSMYHRYGGRGITVCKEWEHDYISFKEWSINNGYTESLSIDRINNQKGYSPDNCRWATSKVQNNNKSNNVVIEIDGEVKTLGQWAELTEIGINVIRLRYKRGDRGVRLLRPLAKGGI